MQNKWSSLENISSARQFAECEEKRRAAECIERDEREQRRKVNEATIAMLAENKRQNEILRIQLDLSLIHI